MSDYKGAEIMMQFVQEFKEKKQQEEQMRQQAALRKIEQLQNAEWYQGSDAKMGVFDNLLDKLGYQTKDTKTVRANNSIAQLEPIAYGYEDKPEIGNFSGIVGSDATSDNNTWLAKQFFGNENTTMADYQNKQKAAEEREQQWDRMIDRTEERRKRKKENLNNMYINANYERR